MVPDNMNTGDTVYRRDTCRLCKSKDLELVFPYVPTPLADAYIPARELNKPQPVYPLDLYLCRACGFAQLIDVVLPRAIYVDYIYETVSSLGLVDHFNQYTVEVLARIKPARGALVVDIGSNDGTLLRSFMQQGMRVLGVDPAREIARKATESGVETLPEFFTQALALKLKQERGAAAIITANNVFANIDELDDLTAGIRELLAPDGVFIFESYYLADLMENMVFDFIYHEHISSFSVKPLRTFFQRHGMEVIDVLRVPTKGGSIRYTVQKAGGPRPVSPAVEQLIVHESRLGIHDAKAFKTFAAKVDAARAELTAFLDGVRAKGKTIAGYGASATTTTLVYYFGLGSTMSFIADDYPAKQNLFSPGFHIPVLSSNALYERVPDYVIILAWRYYKPIVGAHGKFLDRGGHFIVPLPKLNIL